MNGIPIEYATVMLYSREDSSYVMGAATDRRGSFQLGPIRSGGYFLRISFLGYLPLTIGNLESTNGGLQRDLGKILLVPTVLQGSEVTVIGEKAPIEFHLDKKVINVARQQSSISGSAVDVLEQAPSVTVDIEGNVSLRGSSNFTVLVDGRPSILDPNDALQQIPASSIDRIEIITNPSAKYSPEGTAGIFNVILNKNRSQGISGMVNLNGGLEDKKGVDVLLTRRNDGILLTFAGDYDDREFPGDSKSINRTTVDGVTSNYTSEGSRSHKRSRYGLRGEIEWTLNSKDLLSVGGRVGGMSGNHQSDLDYEQWIDDGPHELYYSRNKSERSGDFGSLYSYYRHRFASEGNELTANLQYRSRDSEEESVNERFASTGALYSGQQSSESGPAENIDIKLEYLRELPADRKLEAGYEGDINRSEDSNELAEYDTLQQAYISQPQYEYKTDYTRNIHALYATFGDEGHKLGYQLGMRGEYTYRVIDFSGQAEQFTIDRWDYFPSAHFSLNLTEGKQLMTSYSRRIQRARGWQLEPYETWMDAYNVRRGNPALKPEYIDSYEAGFLTDMWKGSLSLEAFYRFTDNRVEHIREVYAENVTLMTFENVGKDYSLGGEVQYDVKPTTYLETSLSGNVYDYRIKGDYEGRSFDEHDFSWNARLSNTVKIGKTLRWQLDGNYRSPQITSQGQREGFIMANTSLRKEFMKKTLTLTLQVRDLFGGMKRENTTTGSGFYDYSKFSMDSPVVMLNI
ncbi:TonB-dependent receptor, partial [bacterium]|nr:TonB-dependent receptor [bacterium]